MKVRWRQMLPPLPLLMVWISLYCLTYLLDIGRIVNFGVKTPGRGIVFRCLLLLIFSVLHGYFRVRNFHPAINRKYRDWLAITPWSWKKVLPQGPVHLIWIDFVIEPVAQ